MISVFRSRERDEAEGILVIFYTKNVAVDQMLLERKLETGNGDRDSSKHQNQIIKSELKLSSPVVGQTDRMVILSFCRRTDCRGFHHLQTI